MPPIKVGILGYGFATKSFHLPFLLSLPSLYTVTAILQRAVPPSTAEKGAHCTVDYPDVKHYRTAEAFFADADVEFVVVATHADTHASFAEMAMRAGKDGTSTSAGARSGEEGQDRGLTCRA